jgi:hypothetical protein
VKPASLHELKSELRQLPPAELIELCLRLAKYKVENKELLNYLLFEACDEEHYMRNVEALITEQFAAIPRLNNLHFAKKSVRKILRLMNKYIKYSGKKPTEVQLRIFFCTAMKDSRIAIRQSTALSNLYQQQLKKIKAAIPKLHEDLQYDFLRELEQLEL